MHADHIVLIFAALLRCHLHVVQLLAGFLQAGDLGVFPDVATLEIVKPLINRGFRYIVKLVNTQ